MAHNKFALIFFVLAIAAFVSVKTDTPANCTFEEIKGTWIFYETERQGDTPADCLNDKKSSVKKIRLELLSPNVAVDEFGNRGHWTLIYNQGFEATVNQRVYFAFSHYTQNGSEVTSYCDRTLAGWSHDVLGHNRACFEGKKAESVDPKTHEHIIEDTNGLRRNNLDFVRNINEKQKSWTAKMYSWMHGVSRDHIFKMKGGPKSRILSRPKPAPVSPFVKRQAEFLPTSWDWRNVSGVNYVPPVRNQGGCGSCYAFSSLAMLEARLRVATKNTLQVSLAPQDIVSCSSYSQGCDGGFPYLISGKYAHDFGVVEEQCNPYVGKNSQCSEKPCPRYYVSKYRYVGGYYGACNEELMKIALVQGGPLAVSFEVYPDFMHYAGGIYHHSGLVDKFNPFELTNHAVLLVGYGTDPQSGEDYWIVKNSWGTEWGEKGFFRIRRGTDECGIESIAVEVTPIP